MTLSEIAGLLGLNCSIQTSIISYAADSRNVLSNSLFFALAGNRHDGHEFLAEVAEKGAVAAVVSLNYQGEDFGLILLRVSDPLDALQSLARILLSQSTAKVVAITGSVGKTTTKEFLKVILEERFHVLATPGNQNTQISIPLTILNRLESSHQLIILEMGMTEPGNLTRLVNIAPPYLAIITNIELVHACNFNALEEIGRAKAEILRHPKTEIGIIPSQCNCFDLLNTTGTCRKMHFSKGSALGVCLQKDERLFFLQKHFLHNVQAAIIAAQELGMCLDEIEERFPYLELPKQRFEMVIKRGITFVNDSYNASTLSVKAALDALPLPKNNRRRIAVLGEMLELGKFSEACHKEVGEYAFDKADALFLLGDGCRPIVKQWTDANRAVSIYDDHQDLVESLRENVQSGDVVLIKGSRSKEMWKVIDLI